MGHAQITVRSGLEGGKKRKNPDRGMAGLEQLGYSQEGRLIEFGGNSSYQGSKGRVRGVR